MPDQREGPPGSQQASLGKQKDQALLTSPCCCKIMEPYASYKLGGHLTKEQGEEVKYENLASTQRYVIQNRLLKSKGQGYP